MASPGSVVIQFLVDSKNAAKGAADLAKNFGKVDKEADALDATLDGLDRELDSIGRAADGLGDDMRKAGIGFDTVGDEAEQAADRVRRAAQDMARGVHDGGQKIDVEADGIKGSLKETGSEAGAELIGSIAEGIGSGTGTIRDTVQGALGGITNLAASIGGPVGLAAGAAAAGVGLVFAAVTKQAEETKKRIDGMVAALVEVGTTAGDVAKQAQWEAWIGGLEEGSTTIADIAEGLRISGVEQGLFKDAVTGSTAAQREILREVDKQLAAMDDLKEKQGGLGFMDSERQRKLKLIKSEIEGGNSAIDQTNSKLRDTDLLTGDVKKSAESWADEQRRVYDEAHKTAEVIEGIPNNVPVNINVRYTEDPRGRPGHVGPAAAMAAPQVGVATMAAPARTATLPPQTINVHVDQWGSARVTKRALEANDRRQGRKPGRPLAVAW